MSGGLSLLCQVDCRNPARSSRKPARTLQGEGGGGPLIQAHTRRERGFGVESERRGRMRRTGDRSGSGQRETWPGERADPLNDSDYPTRPFPHPRSSSRPSGPSCPPPHSRRHIAAVHTDSDYPSQFEKAEVGPQRRGRSLSARAKHNLAVEQIFKFYSREKYRL